MAEQLQVRLTRPMTVTDLAGQNYTLMSGHVGRALELNQTRGLMVDFGTANCAYPVPPAAIGDWAEIVSNAEAPNG